MDRGEAQSADGQVPQLKTPPPGGGGAFADWQ